ncbi:MAG: 2-phospho-L-lactate guanylyltransferase, partial [Actinomycetota bacterium]
RAGLAVVLPVKAFGVAKQRLATVLTDDDRARLARHLATGVADVVRADPAALLVVSCDDADVRDWADGVGATVAWTPGLGLNRAISAGCDTAAGLGATHLVVAHADLARPASLLAAASPGALTVVPDRHRDGTNVMSFPSDTRIEPSYGPSSFARHLRRAQDLGIATGHQVRLLADPDLALDVDTPTDLRHPTISKELPSWLRIPPDNRCIPAG